MPVVYFDTCALAKRYYREPGHRKVKELVGNPANTIVFSNIGVVEMSSVIHKKIRNNNLTSQNGRLRLARFVFETKRDYLTLPADNDFLKKSLGYVNKHGLTTLDSIHFATAKKVESECSNFVFISADSALVDAAKAENMNYVNPDP
ncbi:type II toxin-antitoxin system VapC family toxin [Haloplanus halobius]|uniref:type II toxin-antitoxin system VapC family toxin n=1 Tax=Haloplanus halobius TaxID=2934938 RepID=UPI00200E1B23|nr:type II toxin-antitoxin system VapC family toxin [Haloplanus sp. XH21]